MISYELFKIGEPIVNPDLDKVGKMVADLRSWAILPAPDEKMQFSSLIPLRRGDQHSGLSYKWADALSDDELSLGYFPQTPKTVAGWIGVVDHFINSKHVLLYRIMGKEHPDQNLAEIDFTFSEQEGVIFAEFAYGLIDRNQKGRGIVSSAFLMLRDVLPELATMSGVKIGGLKTCVSTKNVHSLRIMEKVGMSRSNKQDNKDARIVMGGKNIEFEYYY